MEYALCFSPSRFFPVCFFSPRPTSSAQLFSVCVLFSPSLFFRVGDGRRREPDFLQTGRTQTRNRVFCPGTVSRCVARDSVSFRSFGSFFFLNVVFPSRSAVTLWASMAHAKLGSGASGAIPPRHPRPTAVSAHWHALSPFYFCFVLRCTTYCRGSLPLLATGKTSQKRTVPMWPLRVQP